MRVVPLGLRRQVLVSNSLDVSFNYLYLLTIPSGFFLITTDVLGPYGSGYTMGTLGWGPGASSFCYDA